tara:strand:- start:1084 stop:1548 length:465 start_codon:yes stop_codon:yes gene_type:complete
MKIIKNWLRKDVGIDIRDYLLGCKYEYRSTSTNKSSNTFFISNFDLTTNQTIMWVAEKLVKEFGYDINIVRAYANLQFTGMNGEWHTDDGETTCLWMATESLPKESGEFQTKDKKVKFDFNKLIMFDSKKAHRGMGPKKLNTPRITLAFKTKRA